MLLLAALSIATTPAKLEPLAETPAQKNVRMKWWREARFGMFIHWGLYSVPAGYWNGKEVPGAAEWLQYTAQVKPRDYEPLQQKFNPVKFDADKWVSIAKNAGMKYIVITSKHHEGFGMWPSKQGTWNIGHTQFHRDPLKELAIACKKQGIRLGFYHSIMDWHEPDYLPRRPWDDRDASKADFDRYVTYMKAQLKELLSGDYGPISVLWFDGQWEGTWTHERGEDLYKFVRSLQPNIIINNRVEKGGANDGDYGTPEQTIPGNGLPGVDWESCMTMNDTWGFSSHDHNWKSSDTLIRNVIECASKGGNYLLNVGPTSLGEIPPPSVERLAAVGQWMKQNGEAIYATQAGPFPRSMAWGRATRKGSKLYLEVFDSAKDVDLSSLQGKIVRAYTLVGHHDIRITSNSEGRMIAGGQVKMPTPPATVYVLETQGPISATTPTISQQASGALDLTAEDAQGSGGVQYEGGDKRSMGYWTSKNDRISWDVNIRTAGDYRVTLEYSCDAASAGSTFELGGGNASLVGKVTGTGSWTTYQPMDLGVMHLAAGRLKIWMAANSIPKGAVMNVRAVSFRPI